MAQMVWFRSHHGAPFDKKLAVVARHANVTRGHAAAVWWAVLDHASQAEERGDVSKLDPEEVAAAFDFEEEDVVRILDAMRVKDRLISAANRVTNWDKRQVLREDNGAAERKRVERERKKAASADPVTPPSRNVTPGHAPEKIRTDKNREEEEEAAAPDFVVLGNKALTAAGIDPARYTGSFAVVQGWLAQGHRPETIIAAIEERAKRPGYEPKGLDYWTKAIAEFAKRKNNGSMIGEAAKPADPSKTREPTEIELEAFRLAGKEPHPLRKDGGLPKHVLDTAITNGFIPEHMRRQERAA